MSAPQAPAGQIDLADRAIDVTAELCPMTYVRTRLALDRLAPGQVLAVTLKGEEAARNVPATARLQGYLVLLEDAAADGIVRLLIRKKAK